MPSCYKILYWPNWMKFFYHETFLCISSHCNTVWEGDGLLCERPSRVQRQVGSSNWWSFSVSERANQCSWQVCLLTCLDDLQHFLVGRRYSCRWHCSREQSFRIRYLIGRFEELPNTHTVRSCLVVTVTPGTFTPSRTGNTNIHIKIKVWKYFVVQFSHVYNSTGTLHASPKVLNGLSANERREKQDGGRKECFERFLQRERSNVTRLV